MSNVYLPFDNSTSARIPNSNRRVSTIYTINTSPFTLDLSGANSATVFFAAATPALQSLSGTMDSLHLKTDIANSMALASASFQQGGHNYVVNPAGSVVVDVNPATGSGTIVGTLAMATGDLALTAWPVGTAPAALNWNAVAAPPANGAQTPFITYSVTFRIATAPIVTGSLSIQGTMTDGTLFNVSADSSGHIVTSRVLGSVNYTTGVVQLVGVAASAPPNWVASDVSALGLPGVTTAFVDTMQVDTLRYNAVAYTYLPLDANLLGIDPVRLPTNGLVPIFQPGGYVVLGNTLTTVPATATNGGTVNCGRVRLSRVRVLGADGLVIATGYTVDLDAGVVTWVNVSTYAQPVRVEHRIEDMGQVRDAQIDGTLTLLQPVTHDYPVGSYVSSAFVQGDMRARVSATYSQASWDSVTYSGILVGSAALASYNTAAYPLVVTNAGALTENFAIRFTSTTAFQVIGQHVGLIGQGTINSDCAITDPNTGAPYFTILALGWGGGWAIGNVLFVCTVGALAPLWIARTIKQGPASGIDYSFSLLVRGDIDNPL